MRHLVATDQGFAFLEGRTRITSLDKNGRRLWGTDIGAAEESPLLGLTTTGHDTLVALVGANRLITVDPRGRTGGSISPFGVDDIDAFVPLTGNRFAAVTTDSAAPLVIFDNQGKRLSRNAFPSADFSALRPLMRQGWTATDDRLEHWVFGFAFGDGFVVLDTSAGALTRGRFIESTNFPDVIRRTQARKTDEILGAAVQTAVSIALRDTEVVVLYAGKDRTLAKRVIDRYSIHSGKYVGSYELPWVSRWIAAKGKRLFVLHGRYISELHPSTR
ncbi:MAG: hypothetical protein V4550_02475 [Gemmatimonadota bacterium]